MANNKTYTVSERDMMQIFNLLTYDKYAALQRSIWRAGLRHRPPFAEYTAACKDLVALESLSSEAWRIGYLHVADLFELNERLELRCDEEALFEQDINLVLAMVNKRHH
jgi:hypothetical protein